MELNYLIEVFGKLFLVWGIPIVIVSSIVEMSPLGWFLPGGVLVSLAGFYSFGNTNLLAAIIFASWISCWLTFVLTYVIGVKTGNLLIINLKQQKNASRAKILLEKYGGVILTTSMMGGLTRFWIAYVAGMQKYNFVKYVSYSGIASLTWSSLMAIVGFLAGSQKEQIEKATTSLGLLSWFFVFLAFAVIYITNKKEYKEFKGGKS